MIHLPAILRTNNCTVNPAWQPPLRGVGRSLVYLRGILATTAQHECLVG